VETSELSDIAVPTPRVDFNMKFPTVSTTTKIYVLLVNSVLAGVWYLLDPESSLLSVPYAMLIVKILGPVMQLTLVGNILLVPAGNAVAAPYIVRLTDVCVGLFLLVTSGLFLWLRGTSKLAVVGTVLSLFVLNTVRVVSVIIALGAYGYAFAAMVHDVFYAGFTCLAILIMAYGAYGAYRSLLNPPASGVAQLTAKETNPRSDGVIDFATSRIAASRKDLKPLPRNGT
jgi:hypothetical protein